MKTKMTAIDRTADWLRRYAGRKPIKHYGGCFWGINRNRCLKLTADEIEKLVQRGHAELNGNQLTMKAPG